jgi:hypothetical protein
MSRSKGILMVREFEEYKRDKFEMFWRKQREEHEQKEKE